LQAAAAAALASRVRAAAQPPAKAFVTSEVGRLKRVIVHEPGAEVRKAFPLLLGNHSMLTWELLREEAAAQHKAMVARLTEAGVEVLAFEKLLGEALTHARQAKAFAKWLERYAPQLVPHEPRLTVDSLLGRDDQLIYRRDASGAIDPLVSPATVLFFTRDLAVMTPRGLVLGNFEGDLRSFEAALTRLVFQHAPALAKYPVGFDAAAEKVHLQGGDLLVLDESTLLLGVGNSTDERAAELLAQKLEIDVVAVQMPSKEWQPGEWEGLQLIFYHLDCLLNLVDARKALAVPYLLEKQHAQQNPILEALYGLARLSKLPAEQRVALVDEVRNVGWVRRYQAGSGELDRTLGRVKVLDYLKSRGYEIVFAGGTPPAGGNDLQHAIEHVIRECRFMGVNVLTLRPGHALAYEGNPHTLAVLKSAGVQATTFPSHELVRANGGPHCLTLPLERD
jgi:arginine deiminase